MSLDMRIEGLGAEYNSLVRDLKAALLAGESKNPVLNSMVKKLLEILNKPSGGDDRAQDIINGLIRIMDLFALLAKDTYKIGDDLYKLGAIINNVCLDLGYSEKLYKAAESAFKNQKNDSLSSRLSFNANGQEKKYDLTLFFAPIVECAITCDKFDDKYAKSQMKAVVESTVAPAYIQTLKERREQATKEKNAAVEQEKVAADKVKIEADTAFLKKKAHLQSVSITRDAETLSVSLVDPSKKVASFKNTISEIQGKLSEVSESVKNHSSLSADFEKLNADLALAEEQRVSIQQNIDSDLKNIAEAANNPSVQKFKVDSYRDLSCSIDESEAIEKNALVSIDTARTGVPNTLKQVEQLEQNLASLKIKHARLTVKMTKVSEELAKQELENSIFTGMRDDVKSFKDVCCKEAQEEDPFSYADRLLNTFSEFLPKFIQLSNASSPELALKTLWDKGINDLNIKFIPFLKTMLVIAGANYNFVNTAYFSDQDKKDFLTVFSNNLLVHIGENIATPQMKEYLLLKVLNAFDKDFLRKYDFDLFFQLVLGNDLSRVLEFRKMYLSSDLKLNEVTLDVIEEKLSEWLYKKMWDKVPGELAAAYSFDPTQSDGLLLGTEALNAKKKVISLEQFFIGSNKQKFLDLLRSEKSPFNTWESIQNCFMNIARFEKSDDFIDYQKALILHGFSIGAIKIDELLSFIEKEKNIFRDQYKKYKDFTFELIIGFLSDSENMKKFLNDLNDYVRNGRDLKDIVSKFSTDQQYSLVGQVSGFLNNVDPVVALNAGRFVQTALANNSSLAIRCFEDPSFSDKCFRDPLKLGNKIIIDIVKSLFPNEYKIILDLLKNPSQNVRIPVAGLTLIDLIIKTEDNFTAAMVTQAHLLKALTTVIPQNYAVNSDTYQKAIVPIEQRAAVYKLVLTEIPVEGLPKLASGASSPIVELFSNPPSIELTSKEQVRKLGEIANTNITNGNLVHGIAQVTAADVNLKVFADAFRAQDFKYNPEKPEVHSPLYNVITKGTLADSDTSSAKKLCQVLLDDPKQTFPERAALLQYEKDLPRGFFEGIAYAFRRAGRRLGVFSSKEPKVVKTTEIKPKVPGSNQKVFKATGGLAGKGSAQADAKQQDAFAVAKLEAYKEAINALQKVLPQNLSLGYAKKCGLLLTEINVSPRNFEDAFGSSEKLKTEYLTLGQIAVMNAYTAIHQLKDTEKDRLPELQNKLKDAIEVLKASANALKPDQQPSPVSQQREEGSKFEEIHPSISVGGHGPGASE